jgi:DNA-binding transcriptional regulator YhcF (GntR family)
MSEFKDIFAKEAHARLIREMKTGAWANATQLPRESELATIMGISRTQLRDILAVLECEGFITRRHGVGTLINRHVLQLPVRIDMEQADGSVIQEYHEFDENGAHLGRLSDGLHVYEDLIVYTIDGVAQHAGLVMDEEGNYYYINSSKKGVRNTTYNISEAWTNGLLPAGTYAFDETGKMILA